MPRVGFEPTIPVSEQAKTVQPHILIHLKRKHYETGCIFSPLTMFSYFGLYVLPLLLHSHSTACVLERSHTYVLYIVHCWRPKVLHCATRRRCSSHFRVNYFVNLSRFYGTTGKIWIGPDIAGLCQEKYHSGRCNVGLEAKQTLEHPLKFDLGRRNCVSSYKVVCIYVDKLQDGPLCVSYAQISYQTVPKIVLTQ
jgi:hypothetical protein